MAIRTFWLIFFKIIGLKILSSIVGLVSIMSLYNEQNSEMEGDIYRRLFIGISFLAIVFVLLFKSGWIIDLLRLDDGFPENRIDVNIGQVSILRVATILIGGMLLIDCIPWILPEIAKLFDVDPFQNSTNLAKYFIQLALGYILISKNKLIVDFIIKHSSDVIEKEIDDETLINEIKESH
jgi:hypothetical protein